MKTLTTLILLLAAPAFAGTPVVGKGPVAPPPADPCLFTWFAGGSVGYLTELEEPMYHLHVGTDTCWNVGGWDIALFAEIGYAEKKNSFRYRGGGDYGLLLDDGDTLSISDLDNAFRSLTSQTALDSSYKLRIIPITANIKFEREIANNLGAYFGAGLGVANIDFSARVGGFSFSDDDWVFVAQAFAGLVYNVTSAFEVYGGGRYIYYSDPSFSSGGVGGKLDMGNEFLIELGGRYNF